MSLFGLNNKKVYVPEEQQENVEEDQEEYEKYLEEEEGYIDSEIIKEIKDFSKFEIDITTLLIRLHSESGLDDEETLDFIKKVKKITRGN